jgi:hypothetical protein
MNSMKSLLAKIAIGKYVGLCLGEHDISASVVAATPLGPIEIASFTEPCPPNELLTVIDRVLQSLQGGKRRRLQIAIGLPNSRVFFGTRPLRTGADASPEAVVQKLLLSSNVSADDLTIDMITSTVDKASWATVGACRKKYMAAVLGVLEQYSTQVVRTEPAPCALVRAAARQYRPPRRSKTLLRIFLGADEGLAVLTVAGLPRAWRSFAMPSFSEGMAILSSARTLLSQSRYYEMSTPLDYAIVHGRPDLHDRLQKEGLPTEIGARMVWHDGPVFGGATAALGLALGCLNQNAQAFDLSRTMKPRPLLRDIFPWGELVCECTLMAGMGLVLMQHSEKVNAAYLSVRNQCEGNKTLALSTMADLQKEKTELKSKLDSMHGFLDSRIAWTSYIRDIASILPANIELNGWQGNNVMAIGKAGSKNKRALQFTGSAPLAANAPVPPEVAKFLKSLRTNPLIKRDFASTEITNIKPVEAKAAKPGEKLAGKVGEKAGTVEFTIVCRPEAAKKKGAK